MHDKAKVQTVTYDMETYLEMTVKRSCDVTGFDKPHIQDGTIAEPCGRDQTSSRSSSGASR